MHEKCSTPLDTNSRPSKYAGCVCRRCSEVFVGLPCKPNIYCSKRCLRADQAERRTLVKCAHCPNLIVAVPSNPRKYCSTDCYRLGRRRRRESTCLRCSKPFSRKASKSTVFCCEDCRRKHQAATQRAHGACKKCGKPITRKLSVGVDYCSPDCYQASQKKYEIRETTCEKCARLFSFALKPHGPARYCCRACYNAAKEAGAFSAENHPNFRGGYDTYYGASWRSQRRKARRRDKVCQDCGVSPETLGRVLDVHHLIAFREFGVEQHVEANDLCNLISLCKPCHARREWPVTNPPAYRKPRAPA